MLITKFAIPDIIFGHGSIKYLAQCARRLGAQRILLVSDSGLEASGWVDQVRQSLEDDRLDCVYFNDVSSNPRDHQVHNGAKLYLQEKADVIVALGGGSPMDAAKGIATIAGNGGKISDYEGANRIMRPLPPMIFIPSTAGSGSDISQYCIITDVERQVKMSIISRSLVPNISITDPDLLLTKSRSLITASAVDAFAHAVESYLSPLASPFTESQAILAMRLFIKNILPAVQDRDQAALEELSTASAAAGMSFSNAGLGTLHALAHSLGGMYDVLHGMVHPVLLPAVMRYNLSSNPKKLGDIGRIVIGPRVCSDERAALAGIDRLEELFAEMDTPLRLRDLLPDRTPLEKICSMATRDACQLTNPRAADCDALMGICEEVW